MRTLTTLLTLGAGAAGYAYLQQPRPVGEPYHPVAATPPSMNWKLASAPTSKSSHVPTRDLINEVREHTRSVFEDVTKNQLNDPLSLNEDAFDRLRKVAESAVVTTTNASTTDDVEVANQPLSSNVPVPDSVDLKRTAFETVETNLKQINQPDDKEVVEALSRQAEKTIEQIDSIQSTDITQPKIENSDPSKLSDRLIKVTSKPLSADVSSMTPIAEFVAENKAKRTTATLVSNRSVKEVKAEWSVIGKSTEGRPMHKLHLGDSGPRTLVIAGINGDDRTGVHWLELLAEELRRRPEFVNTNDVIFIRAGNPDGLIRNVRNNARGVPLSRNFPGRRFLPNIEQPLYAVAGGEVETRVIMDTLYSFRPQRVIHLGSTPGKSQVFYNQSAKSLASDFERSTGVKSQLFAAEQFPGSLEDFVDGALEASVVSLQLSVENDWKQAWNKAQIPVLSTVVGRSIEATGLVSTEPSRDTNRGLTPTATNEISGRKTRRRGYEELPAPPQR